MEHSSAQSEREDRSVWKRILLQLWNQAVFSLFDLTSHFHLDHCGALPYFSEMVGYDGPIYMTHPTKAICPILLVCWTLLFKITNSCSINYRESSGCRKFFVCVLHTCVALEFDTKLPGAVNKLLLSNFAAC